MRANNAETSVLHCPGPSTMNLHREAAIYYTMESNVLRPQLQSINSKTQLLELRLIQSFLTAGFTMENSYPNEHHVSMSIKSIFLLAADPRHWYLMDIIMGCTAASLRATNPHDITLVEASHTYAVRSIQECSKQIREGICASNAEGLFVASLLIAMHAFTSRQFDLIGEEDYNVTGRLPLVLWLRQFQGVKAVRQAGWQWIQKSGFVGNLLSALPAKVKELDSDRDQSLNNLLEGLESEHISAETLAAYAMPVNYLSMVIADPNHHGILGFPVSISEKFLELLESRDPRSMIIIATYLALITISRRSAYLLEAAKRDFNFIMAHLPPEWLPRMNWARSIFATKTCRENDLIDMNYNLDIINSPTFSTVSPNPISSEKFIFDSEIRIAKATYPN
jgi:hypothetical protein